MSDPKDVENDKENPCKKLNAFNKILEILADLNDEQRERVIMTIAVFYGVAK